MALLDTGVNTRQKLSKRPSEDGRLKPTKTTRNNRPRYILKTAEGFSHVDEVLSCKLSSEFKTDPCRAWFLGTSTNPAASIAGNLTSALA